MRQEEFDNFFRPYSRNVDTAAAAYFWHLSDTIILELLTKYLRPSLSSESLLLDAGGGTGRWIVKMASAFPCRFLLYDLSTDMLERARATFAQHNLEPRVTVKHGDLCRMQAIMESSVDHIVSIYSPISFVDEPHAALRELFRILKPGGRIMIMGHGFYNALFSKANNYLADPNELTDIEVEGMVKWDTHVPRLHLFSKESLERLLMDAGFEIIATHGVPVFVQPAKEDFDPTNRGRSRISKALETRPDFYQRILQLELQYSGLPTVANRGVNIFSVGIKPVKAASQ